MAMRAHLVSGAGAGGALKEACSEHGLLGIVFAIDDDLHVGPLYTLRRCRCYACGDARRACAGLYAHIESTARTVKIKSYFRS